MLTTALLTTGTLLATVLPTLAQQPAPPVALAIGVANTYHLQPANSRLANYYALINMKGTVAFDGAADASQLEQAIQAALR